MQPFEAKYGFVKCYIRKFSKTNKIYYSINIISYTHNMKSIFFNKNINSLNIAYTLDYISALILSTKKIDSKLFYF